MRATAPCVFPLPGGGALLGPPVAALQDTRPEALQQLFDPSAYGPDAAPVGSGGRQAAWFVEAGFGAGVLRHYRRGGLVARVNRSDYLWLGRERTRSWREFQLMCYLHNKGAAVPEPLAAAWWRHGAAYRAALLTRRIPDVRPLAQCLAQARPEAVAAAIAQMHQLQVWHADLNAYNILLDQGGKVWLIDFDRGTAGALGRRRALGNLQRLRRSLRKLRGEDGERWWQALLCAYRQLMQF